MKKLVVILFICLAAVVTIQYYSSHKNTVNSLLIDNIEALAADEYTRPTQCYGSGSVDCPVTHTKVKLVGYGYR